MNTDRLKNVGQLVLFAASILVPSAFAGSYSFGPSADATVQSASPSKNYGSTTTLETDGDGSKTTKESYLKFAVSGVSGTVTKAIVRVYATDGSGDGPGIYAVSNTSWTESGITWNNKPARGSKLQGKGAISAGTFVDYDVTAAVQGNGTYSFGVAAAGSDGVKFSSRNASSNRPKLLITTGTAVPAPSSTSTPAPSPAPSPIASSSPTSSNPLSGAVFTSLGSSDTTIGGVTYSNQSAEKSYSIMRSQNGGIYRFELHEGENRTGKDPSDRDRAELNQGIDYPKGTDLWASYSFMLDKGEALPGGSSFDNVFTQWHGGVGSPPLSIRIPTDNTLFVRQISGSSSNGVNTIPYTKNDFKRGTWYHVVQHAVFRSDGKGIIEIWIDGVKVVNLQNVNTTYTDSTANYFKFGVYRDRISQVEVVYYANMEAGMKNLADRVGHPLAIEP